MRLTVTRDTTGGKVVVLTAVVPDGQRSKITIRVRRKPAPAVVVYTAPPEPPASTKC